MRIRWSITLLFFLIVCNLHAADNPFLTKDSASEEKKEEQVDVSGMQRQLFARQFRKIVEIQRTLYTQLSQGIRTIKNGESPFAWAVLALVVFLYGIFHALGPGHGKIFIISYFLSRRAPLLKGFLFSFTTAFFHAAISTGAVLILYTVLEHGLMRSLENTQHHMMTISYGMITLVGIVLVFHGVLKRKKDPHDEEQAAYCSSRHFFPMALSIAVTPCPATILVLLFSLTNGLLVPGIFAVFFLATGMGLSLGIVALITIGTSSASVHLLTRYTGAGRAVARILSIAGPVCIVLAGGVLFTARFF